MATITAPDFTFRGIEWSLSRPSQSNKSLLTGKRTTPAQPWFGKWQAQVDLATMQGQDAFRLLRSFFIRCQGPVNAFKLYAVVENQNANSGVTVSGTAAKGATTMALSGASTPLLAGQMITVNDQLLTLTANQSGSSVTFEPQLRAAASGGTSVETSRPWALMRLSGSQISWSHEPASRFSASFAAEEAF